MPDYWGPESGGIWRTESGGGWLIELQTPAGTCQLVDLATVKTRLGIGDTSQDAYLTAQIDYISAFIQNYCQRIFCAGDYIQTMNRPIDTGLVWGMKGLYLGAYPVNSIASVTVNGTVVDAADYSIDKRTGLMISTEFLTGYDIEVQFNAGFSPIPADVSMAAEDLVVSRYAGRNSDPTKVVRSESVPEVGSVDYVASTYQRGSSTVLGIHQETIDWYRTERHFDFDASL